MQFISKAYQYYSGINPATLTGAIDVIVVRRRDENGDYQYCCSPFHVRFGKLQVLRAGEKKVTIQLPDNLPAPSEAPFWMKVGEAGEAFFVVETDEDVPLELQTSPVVVAADAPLTPPASDGEDWDVRKGEADKSGDGYRPFDGGDDGGTGKTNIDEAGGSRGEPDFLDLSAQGSSEKSEEAPPPPAAAPEEPAAAEEPSKSPISSVSPSSILSSAATLIPNVLKPSSSQTPSIKSTDSSPEKAKPAAARSSTPPPNPLRKESDPEQHGAERIKDYVKKNRDKANGRGSAGGEFENPADSILPAIKDGDGDGPTVVYKSDVVLDMAGYHQPSESSTQPPSPKQSDDDEDDVKAHMNGITESLKADLHNDITAGSDDKVTSKLIAFTQDLLASAEPATASDDPSMQPGSSSTFPRMRPKRGDMDTSDIDRRLDSLHLEASKVTPRSSLDEERPFIRANSEPAGELERLPLSLGKLDLPPPPYEEPTDEDYTWAWGELPTKTPVQTPGPMDASRFESPFAVFGPAETAAPAAQPREDLQRTHSAPIVADEVDLTHSPNPLPVHRSQTFPVGSDPFDIPPHHHERHESEDSAHSLRLAGKLKNSEDDPFKFILDMGSVAHVFEMASWEGADAVPENIDADEFHSKRVTFQRFIEDPALVDSPKLVVRYNESFLTWQNASPVMTALAIYRRSLQPPTSANAAGAGLPPLSKLGVDPSVVPPAASKGYGWSRWWRRSQAVTPTDPVQEVSVPSTARPEPSTAHSEPVLSTAQITTEPVVDLSEELLPRREETHYAKTLRLTSDQLGQLNLKDGPNKVVFSVTSSYSGIATCTARIFLWDEHDQVVISDIDGTITKSDALGHVFAAIGRDWTHLGVAKLYTDIRSNGYRIMYLTSRAIGQADSTRDYLKGIHQGSYQLPDGPVIMSPDRLMASLHREVIMRKPEIFKMACLRDIQRLFVSGTKNPFYAGFGNRITDAMSYRSVNVPSSRIFTIDSGGEVKMELLELVGYKSSYIHMTDLVDQMFPPVHRKFAPEFTDFNYWRPAIADIELPDLSPVSPALSATSDASGRLSVLRSLTNLGRRGSRQTVSSADGTITSGGNAKYSNTSRPTSPLVAAYSASDSEYDELSEPEDFSIDHRYPGRQSSMPGSLPGSFGDEHDFLHRDDDEDDDPRWQRAMSEPLPGGDQRGKEQYDNQYDGEGGDRYDGRLSEDDGDPEMFDADHFDDEQFDDNLLATGEMSKVPY